MRFPLEGIAVDGNAAAGRIHMGPSAHAGTCRSMHGVVRAQYQSGTWGSVGIRTMSEDLDLAGGWIGTQEPVEGPGRSQGPGRGPMGPMDLFRAM